MTNDTKPLYGKGIEDLQSMQHDTTKRVGDKFVPDGAPPIVNENDRKTGELGGNASEKLQNYGTATHG
jgi:hypothetical protein